MADMTEQEAWELDELLTKTTPEVSPTVEGPFIRAEGFNTHRVLKPDCNSSGERK